MKFVINADDYGLDLLTTQAIIEAFSRHLCTNATIVANGKAFAEAVELARQHSIIKLLGIHLNLSEGIPLTGPIREVRTFCDERGYYNSAFRFHSPVKLRGFTALEKEVVKLELKAQLEKCLEAGIPLKHADSHHHVHTRWEVWQVVKPLLKEFGIPRVRISANCKRAHISLKQVYKYLFNQHLRWTGFETSDYFGCTGEVSSLIKRRPQLTGGHKLIEVMVHPLYKETCGLYDLNGLKLEDSVGQVEIGL